MAAARAASAARWQADEETAWATFVRDSAEAFVTYAGVTTVDERVWKIDRGGDAATWVDSVATAWTTFIDARTTALTAEAKSISAAQVAYAEDVGDAATAATAAATVESVTYAGAVRDAMAARDHHDAVAAAAFTRAYAAELHNLQMGLAKLEATRIQVADCLECCSWQPAATRRKLLPIEGLQQAKCQCLQK